MSQGSLGQGTYVSQLSGARARPIVVWAVGELRALSDVERRLTAAVFAHVPGVVEHVRRTGHVPTSLAGAGRELSIVRIVAERGLDLDLTADERAIFDALGEGDTVPSERAVLLDGRAL